MCVCVCVCLCVCVFVFSLNLVVTTEEAEQEAQVQGDQTVAKRSRKFSIPQVMATNPMYEASTPIYDCVTENKGLKVPGVNCGDASMEMSACGTLPLDIPPQLPVRKNTLESPGVKSTAKLVMEKSALASNSEEYLCMKPSLDSRYAKVPLPKVKMAEESMTSPDNMKE